MIRQNIIIWPEEKPKPKESETKPVKKRPAKKEAGEKT